MSLFILIIVNINIWSLKINTTLLEIYLCIIIDPVRKTAKGQRDNETDVSTKRYI